MTKTKYILAILLVLVLAAGVTIGIFSSREYHDDPFILKEEVTVKLWYAEESKALGKLEKLVSEFNSGDGEKQKVTVELKSFESTEKLYEALSDASKSRLPNIVICDTDEAKWLSDNSKSADLYDFFSKNTLNDIDASFIEYAEDNNRLMLLPMAIEADLLVSNNALYDNADKIGSFEELCNVASEYYRKNDVSFFSIDDYAGFFKSALAQLGENFDGVSPYDTESENVKNIYKTLAEAAFSRGYTYANENSAAMVAKGELACAIVSSVDIAENAELFESGSFDVTTCPKMDGGSNSYCIRILGMTMLEADSNEEYASAIFMKWMIKENSLNTLLKNSGYQSASASVITAESGINTQLIKAIKKLEDSCKLNTFGANAEFATNCADFNDVLSSLMSSLS